MRLLITGASGLLGSNLLVAAQARGLPAVGLYGRQPFVLSGVPTAGIDLCDAAQVTVAVQRWRPTWIIHCAALTNVDQCEADPARAHQVNTTATAYLAQAALAVGARLAYISTDSVFDGATGQYTEADPPHPLNQYAASKLAGEQAVQAADARSLIVRTNIYGWNAQPKHSLAEWVLARLERHEPVPGFSDVTFSPLLVNDLADALFALLAGGASGLLHLAGGEACTKLDFARQLAEVFGYDPGRVQPAELAHATLRAPRPHNTSLNTARAAAQLGHPLPAVRAGLERLLALRAAGHDQFLHTCHRSEDHA